MLSRFVIVFTLIVVCFSACNFQKNSNIQTYIVTKKNFENAIAVSGVIESSRVVNVQSPALDADLTIIDIVPEGNYVRKGDTVCYLQCTEIENQYKEAVKNLDLAKSELEKIQASQKMAYDLLESQIKTIESQTSISELDTLSYRFYSPLKLKIAKLELQKAYCQKEKIVGKRNFLKKMREAEIQKQKLKIQKEEASVMNAKEQLLKLKLVSMADGYVEYANPLWSTGAKAKVGDKVWYLMPILKVSDMASIQVKMLVNESHFKRIEKDQKIDIAIDAYPAFKLTGKIINKSPNGKPVKEKSSVKMFEVTASIDSLPYKVQPGVSISCKVYLSSVKDVCPVPITSVFDSDSLKVVYVMTTKGSINRRKVKTGMSSDTEIIIENGIKPNEVILLSEPPDNLIR
jgi:HlyD family secretion protein